MILQLIIIGLAFSVCAAEDETVVNTNYGKIRGFISKSTDGQKMYTFHNIPFAKPPIGKLRLKNPELPEAWEDVRNGVDEHKSCPQPQLFFHIFNQTNKYQGQEDCLHLSVYSPQIGVSLLPVMVYIHGGAFLAGEGMLYDGSDILKKNVVLVSINYRIGVLGFLSTEDGVIPGNLGLKDQTMAFKWVQENIKHFGGDPGQVTIFGESAGAASVHYHILSPTSKGLFSRAILLSGNALLPLVYTTGSRGIAMQVGAAVGCSTTTATAKQQSQELLDCLQQVDEKTLTMTYSKFMDWVLTPLDFVPYDDGEFMPEKPETLVMSGHYDPIDIIIGVTTDEGALFTNSLFSDNDFLDKLQNNFKQYGPLSLDISQDDKSAELSKMIYEHYLNKTMVNIGDVEELTKLYSDRHFKVSTDVVAQMHTGKVYLFEFAYRGIHSLGSVFQRTFGSHWVVHGDELIYLFPKDKLGLKGLNLDENDNKVKDIMITMLVNFARHGNPTPDDCLNFKWEPFNKQSPKHLHINLHPQMKDHPKTEADEFWASLPLERNRLLYGSKTHKPVRNEL